MGVPLILLERGWIILDDTKITLTPEQKRAVESQAKTLVVIAGPGSGKTRVLTERICSLVNNQGVRPEHIMALTFTAAAAKEMKHRVTQQLSLHADPMWVRTFHSAGLQLIKTFPEAAGLKDGFTIIDSDDRKRFIKDKVLPKHTHHYLSEIEIDDAISQVKNGVVSPASLSKDMREALILYNEQMETANLIDLDDMIVKALTLLEQAHIRQQVQQRFRYILVDECQDINRMQAAFLRLLRSPRASVTLVGDLDQCVYEWRGAVPSLIKSYVDAPNTETIHLADNFRSSAPIVALANHIISQNPNRISDKPMVAHGANKYKPIVGHFESEQAQAKFVADNVKMLIDERGYKYKDIAILIRNHAQTPSLEQVFSRTDIPFGGELFWSQNTVGQVLNILYAIVSPHHAAWLPKAINSPTKVMSNLQFQDLCMEHEINHLSTTDQIVTLSVMLNGDGYETFRRRCKAIFELHKSVKKTRATAVLSTILSEFAMPSEDKSHPNDLPFTVAAKRIQEIADEFAQSLPNAPLQELLNYIKQLRSESKSESKDDKVQILTCHHAKGLEFNAVFVVGSQVGIFPNDFFIQNKEDLESERRLFYVAITRAREVLYITSYDDPDREPASSSFPIKSFTQDIPQDLPQNLYQPLY